MPFCVHSRAFHFSEGTTTAIHVGPCLGRGEQRSLSSLRYTSGTLSLFTPISNSGSSSSTRDRSKAYGTAHQASTHEDGTASPSSQEKGSGKYRECQASPSCGCPGQHLHRWRSRCQSSYPQIFHHQISFHRNLGGRGRCITNIQSIRIHGTQHHQRCRARVRGYDPSSH